MSVAKPLTIALPTGRILDPVVELFRDAGIRLNFGHDKRSLTPSGGPEGFRFLVLRPEDSAGLIERGIVDAAFIGADVYEELGAKKYAERLLDTGLSPVKLCAAAAQERLEEVRQALNEKQPLRAATKYPQCTKNWAVDRLHTLDTFPVRGSVEAFARLGFDFIVDVVDSGQTLTANSLSVLEEISTSTTCLFGTAAAAEDSRLSELLYSLESVLRARGRLLLDMNVSSSNRARVLDILSTEALESVNEVPAANGSSTLHLAVRRERLYEVIRRARAAGATNELVTPVLLLGSAK